MAFSTLQNILNCQAEYAFKKDISVTKSKECLLEKHYLIFKFFSQKPRNRKFYPNEIDGLVGMYMAFKGK